jgi:hypothetical protein
MPGILVYALHDDEGNFNKNSLGAISEASRLAAEIGGDAAAVVVGEVADDACQGLGAYGVKKVFRAKSAPEGLAQPIVDVMAKVIQDEGFATSCSAAACSASRSAPAHGPPRRRRHDGGHRGAGARRQARRDAADPPGLAVADVGTSASPGSSSAA